MVNRTVYINKYNAKVRANVYKYEAKVDKIPDLYAEGLRSKFGRDPRPEVVNALRSVTDIMKERYRAYAQNPKGDKWWQNWTLAVFGETL